MVRASNKSSSYGFGHGINYVRMKFHLLLQ